MVLMPKRGGRTRLEAVWGKGIPARGTGVQRPWGRRSLPL